MSLAALMNVLTVLVLFAVSTLTQQDPTPVRQSPATRTSDQVVLTVDPAQSTVRWSLQSSLHTVHGTFHVKRGAISVDPATGKATGEIVIDATTGESGNDSRDHKMHKEILETDRYSEVLFRPDRVDGRIATQGNSSLTVHGLFTLHGADHEFTAPAETELSAEHWKGSATFSVPYIQWKLKNPSNFFLKVKPVVEVHISVVGSVQQAQQ
jgi:polyisoprenoid-binding protein YceI